MRVLVGAGERRQHGDLGTTSPFPYAWIELARGVMWAEQAGDPARGEVHYRRALVYLPEFVAANIHVAVQQQIC